MDMFQLSRFYEQINAEFQVVNGNLENASYTANSNFVHSANYARHRWFNYKEGFSPALVENIFDEFGLTSGSVVCDPFCGAGTTLLAAKNRAMTSLGFEVNPFAAFISRVKTDTYSIQDIAELKSAADSLCDIEISEEVSLPQNEYLHRVFETEMLVVQLNIKRWICALHDGKSKQLLFFAWLCSLEDCSLYRKAGNGLKKKGKKPTYGELPVLGYAIKKILDTCHTIVSDFDYAGAGPASRIYTGSATTIGQKISGNSLDLVLFSPPYANCFDYTKIYYIELWFGDFVKTREEQKDIRMQSIRSHCHATWPARYETFYLRELHDVIIPLCRQEKLWTSRIPAMLNGYFADMEEALRQVYLALKPGGHCAIVVSNSAYAGIIVPTDIFLAKIARRLGFAVLEIHVERLIITSSQQYKKTEPIRKFLRESIIKLEKRKGPFGNN